MAETAVETTDSYLALVPRGLQHAVLDCVTKTLRPMYRLDLTILDDQRSEDIERLGRLVQEANRKKKSKTPDVESACHEGKPVGTTHDLNGSGRHISIGYCSNSASLSSQGIMSYPGLLEGVVWMRLDTDAPVDVIANKLRCVGPLLAVASIWDNVNMLDTQSLEEAVAVIQGVVASGHSLDAAVNLWQRHVTAAWQLSTQDQQDLHDAVSGKAPIKFRLSCARHQSKQYKYTREELLKSVVDIVVPPARTENKDEKWLVDLKRYHVEVVMLIQPTCVAVGLALRPYQYHGAKAFSSGTIPPDLAVPYLSGGVLSGLVRLRPSTAQALLHLAQVQPGDVVLDPCAGIGTIPMEVTHLDTHAFGLGGDVVLTPTAGLGPVASNYIQLVKNNGWVASDLLAWDAVQLPVRSGVVDVIVSDLPFGQRCLSSAKLATLMPLLVSEMARVLTPATGRMVLLCGSYAPLLEGLLSLNQLATQGNSKDNTSQCVWNLPCAAVFPVNVGGLLAWIIEVQRGPGKAIRIPNQSERVRKVAGKRDQIANSRKRQQELKGATTKQRRIQS